MRSQKAFLAILQPENLPDDSRIVSVYRTRYDACDRLWFIDTGTLEYSNLNRVGQHHKVFRSNAVSVF